MLKQFNVYRNSSPRTNTLLPYYKIVQHDCYDDFSTRVIMPLMRNNTLPVWQHRVAPRVNIDFESLMLYSPMLTSLDIAKINHNDFVCNLRTARGDVVAAIDSLITST